MYGAREERSTPLRCLLNAASQRPSERFGNTVGEGIARPLRVACRVDECGGGAFASTLLLVVVFWHHRGIFVASVALPPHMIATPITVGLSIFSSASTRSDMLTLAAALRQHEGRTHSPAR